MSEEIEQSTGDAHASWLREHHGEVTELVQAGVKEALTGWLDAHQDAVIGALGADEALGSWLDTHAGEVTTAISKAAVRAKVEQASKR